MDGFWPRGTVVLFPTNIPLPGYLDFLVTKPEQVSLLAGLLGPGMLLLPLIAVWTVHLWATGSPPGYLNAFWLRPVLPILTFRLDTFSRQDDERFTSRRESLQFACQRWNKTKMSSPKAVPTELEPRNDSNSWCAWPALGHTWAEWGCRLECLCQAHGAWGLLSNNRNSGFICNTRSGIKVFSFFLSFF